MPAVIARTVEVVILKAAGALSGVMRINGERYVYAPTPDGYAFEKTEATRKARGAFEPHYVAVSGGAPASCDCEDRRYRPGRPACKHMVAAARLLAAGV